MENIIFSQKNINQLVLKNRIVMNAMLMGYCDNDKCISEKDLEFYRRRAKGGVAAITLVAAINDLAGPSNMHGIYEKSHLEGIKNLANMLHEYDCKLFVQLFHCGRNATVESLGGKTPIAPSSIPSPIYRTIPKEMTIEDINTTIEDFGQAALNCLNAGVDAVEISCSAGYLLTQFLSPLTNNRTDEYGGSETNRMRFPLKVIDAVRQKVGSDYPVLLRISASDMIVGGYDIQFMKGFCSNLEDDLINAINVTGGWHESPVPQITSHLPEGGFSFLARAIKSVVKIPVIASNRINNGEIARKILEDESADFLGVARPLLIDPEFANKIKQGSIIKKCQACNKGCIERVLKNKEARCAFNPEVGLEYLKIEKNGPVKNILVVGGGPAGMQSAKTLAELGHKVTICLKESELGGKIFVASQPPHKQDMVLFPQLMEEELKALNVEIRYNVEVDQGYIQSTKPDHIIVATGSIPIIPNIRGIQSENVYFAEDVLKGDKKVINKLGKGKNIIIGGGSVGLETAHFIATEISLNTGQLEFMEAFVPGSIKDKIYETINITVIEMEKSYGKGLGGTKFILVNELKKLNVKILTETKVLSILKNKVIVETSDGEKSLPAHNVILAMGYKPNEPEFMSYMKENNIPYTCIGDVVEPRDIMQAVAEAYEVSSRI